MVVRAILEFIIAMSLLYLFLRMSKNRTKASHEPSTEVIEVNMVEKILKETEQVERIVESAKLNSSEHSEFWSKELYLSVSNSTGIG